MVYMTTFKSPIGALSIAAHGSRVCLLEFEGRVNARRMLEHWYPGDPIAEAPDPGGAVAALHAYFTGRLGALDGVEVEMHGTPFQRRVWEALRSVRAGTTTSYAAIARTIGSPSAVRAVGAANGVNPISIVIPCHRVIGANGTLTGYAGGLERKQWLLAHEGALAAARR